MSLGEDGALSVEAAWELIHRADAVILDIDGVVCIGGDLVPGVGAAIEALVASHVELLFATNDSRRDLDGQRQRLAPALPEAYDPLILTAAQALSETAVKAGHRSVRLWGPPAVAAQLEVAGIEVDGPHPTALVTGAVPDGQRPSDPPAGCVELLAAGADWLATNADASVPGPDGRIPDAGAVIDELVERTGRRPHVCGKPDHAMSRLVARHWGTQVRVLVVGDRVDSDVTWAKAAGWSSILVAGEHQPPPASATKGVAGGAGEDVVPDITIPSLAALAGDTAATRRGR